MCINRYMSDAKRKKNHFIDHIRVKQSFAKYILKIRLSEAFWDEIFCFQGSGVCAV